MPFKSEAQKKFFYARLNSKKKQKEEGPSKEVAGKFIEDSKEESPKKERFSKLKKKMKKDY